MGTTSDFRSLMITNSRETSEISGETARMINSEITNQVTRKLDEIKMDLSSQILEAINCNNRESTSVASKDSWTQKTGLNTKVDLRSSGIHRSSEVGNCHTTRQKRPRMTSDQSK